jgi:hypothetical protein
MLPLLPPSSTRTPALIAAEQHMEREQQELQQQSCDVMMRDNIAAESLRHSSIPNHGSHAVEGVQPTSKSSDVADEDADRKCLAAFVIPPRDSESKANTGNSDNANNEQVPPCVSMSECQTASSSPQGSKASVSHSMRRCFVICPACKTAVQIGSETQVHQPILLKYFRDNDDNEPSLPPSPLRRVPEVMRMRACA